MEIELYQLQKNSYEVTWFWLETNFFDSAEVSIIVFGCGVSQYRQFYDQDLDKNQVLPCPYFGYFGDYPGGKIIKQNSC